MPARKPRSVESIAALAVTDTMRTGARRERYLQLAIVALKYYAVCGEDDARGLEHQTLAQAMAAALAEPEGRGGWLEQWLICERARKGAK